MLKPTTQHATQIYYKSMETKDFVGKHLHKVQKQVIDACNYSLFMLNELLSAQGENGVVAQRLENLFHLQLDAAPNLSRFAAFLSFSGSGPRCVAQEVERQRGSIP